MRVIAGAFRGRRLEAPPGQATRPLTDRVKETLFNILGARFALPGQLPGFAVLDVFAGVGSFGIEALSRGAAACTFIEHDRQVLRYLRQNLRALRLDSRTAILSDNVWTARPPLPAGGFGVIFVDPPYRDATDPVRLLDLVERFAPALSPEGLLLLRQPTHCDAPPVEQLRLLRLDDEREYRHMHLLFYARRHTEP
jgi:16S rRNA (guanine966-N2)-methyltransferase